jgi:hypothetical protein
VDTTGKRRIVEEDDREAIALERLYPVREMAVEGVPDTSLSDAAAVVKTEGPASEIAQKEDQRAPKISAVDMTIHLHTLVQLCELIVLTRRSVKSKLIERGIGTATPRDFGMTRLIIHLSASLQPPILVLESFQERVHS